MLWSLCFFSPQRVWQKWGQTSTWQVSGRCQTQIWWVTFSPYSDQTGESSYLSLLVILLQLSDNIVGLARYLCRILICRSIVPLQNHSHSFNTARPNFNRHLTEMILFPTTSTLQKTTVTVLASCLFRLLSWQYKKQTDDCWWMSSIIKWQHLDRTVCRNCNHSIASNQQEYFMVDLTSTAI